MKNLSIGFSPCPNDTYIFYGFVHGRVGTEVCFNKPLLEDVETLNSWAMKKRLDVTKLSFHAMAHVLDEYVILQAGSALGRGCGPLLVSNRQLDSKDLVGKKIAIPGELTTAALLFKMFLPACTDVVGMRFDKIMAAIGCGEVDAGVIIHESRFTYQELGLYCVQDLGQWWEQSSGKPIPLGCIAARRSLGAEAILKIDSMIGASIDHARQEPASCLNYIRQHSQELKQEVVEDHIDLYVNNFSRDLGEEGREAIELFFDRGRGSGGLPVSSKPLFSL